MIDTKELLDRQRKRLLATVLGHCEQSTWWTKLTPLQQRQLREKVLTAVGAYHDLMLDLMRSSDDGTVQNEIALELLDKIYRTVKG